MFFEKPANYMFLRSSDRIDCISINHFATGCNMH
jgi:hypothetical protein